MAMEKLGRYQIRGELGRGGMATVYTAYDPRFEREVAIKILPKAFLHDPQFRTRFDREAKMIALLEHAFIVPVYDFGEEDGQPYIVMRLMTGGDLSDRIKKGAMSPEDAGRVLSRLAHPLDVAHSKGIIHRDLKPGNILFDQYDNALLSDFGIARLKESEASLTGSAIIGTPAYMSPEQIQGETNIDGRSDIYALGVLVYQMLTGHMPYRAETPAKVMMMHILEPVPNISDVRADLPPGFAEVIAKAMAKSPDDRYQTAQEFANDYEMALHGTLSNIPSPFATATNVGQGVPTPSSPTIQAQSLGSTATKVGYHPTSVANTQVASSTTTSESTQVVPAAKASPIRFIIIFVMVAVLIGGSFAIFGLIRNANQNAPAITESTPTYTIEPSATSSLTATPAPEEPTPTDVVIIVVETPTNTPTLEDTATPTPTSEPTFTPTPSTPIEGGADKIAYIRGDEIWIANLDGAGLVQATNDRQSKSALQWTPDGSMLLYKSGLCIKMIPFDGEPGPVDNLICVTAVDYLEDFEVSPDGEQIAISLDNQLYIVPFDIPTLQEVRLRTHLARMAACTELAPYQRNAVLNMHWSADMEQMAIKILGVGTGGIRIELFQVLDITQCTATPRKIDEFPAGRQIEIPNYERSPVLVGTTWDGYFLFVFNTFIRNDGFGDLFVYNSDRKTGNRLNPFDGKCCYRDASFSPDGRYLLFSYQDVSLGADSTTSLYYAPFSELNTGLQLVPLNIPPLEDPREAPHPALRPAQLP